MAAERDYIPRFCTRECQQQIRHVQHGTHSYECACTAWRVHRAGGVRLMVRPVICPPGTAWTEVPMPRRAPAAKREQGVLL